MGQMLSEPVTKKNTTSIQNDQLYVSSSSMQGWRLNMEDAHTQILKLGPESAECSFFAVFDGHGGSAVANYASNELHKKFISMPEYLNGDIKEALSKCFLEIDNDMLSDPVVNDQLAGSTAIVVVIKDDTIYIANLGDSRAISCWDGFEDDLSEDHKPYKEIELKRIIAAGGWIESDRVNGNLALSRAFGDYVYKKNPKLPPESQIVVAVPDIQTRKINEKLEFVVLACDGIWDVMDSFEVVSFIRDRIAEKMEPQVICEELITRCLASNCQMGGLGCDNMTVILICFLNGKTYEEFCNKCSYIYDNNKNNEKTDEYPSSILTDYDQALLDLNNCESKVVEKSKSEENVITDKNDEKKDEENKKIESENDNKDIINTIKENENSEKSDDEIKENK